MVIGTDPPSLAFLWRRPGPGPDPSHKATISLLNARGPGVALANRDKPRVYYGVPTPRIACLHGSGSWDAYAAAPVATAARPADASLAR